MRWIAALALLTGCERVLNLIEVKPGTAAGDGGGAGACERFAAVQEEPFALDVVPASDFSVDASELRAVMIGKHGATSTDAAHVLSRAAVGDPWSVDAANDALPLELQSPRLAADGAHVFGVTPGLALPRVVELAFVSGAWQTQTLFSTDPLRPAVTGVAGSGDQTTLAVMEFQFDPAASYLNLAGAPSWTLVLQDGVDRTGGVASAALSADALTLVYAAPLGATTLPSLFVSHRASANDVFPTGVRMQLPTSTGDELDPWIVGDCAKVYFRRASTRTVFVAY